MTQPHKHLQAELGAILLAWPRREKSSGHSGETVLRCEKETQGKAPNPNAQLSSSHLHHCPVPENRSEHPLEISTQAPSELSFLFYANDSQSQAAC